MSNSSNHSTAIAFDRLLGLIGTRLTQEGRRYQVIDVIPEGPALVLRSLESEIEIQKDQHGQPLRRAARTITVTVYAADGRTLNPLLADLAGGPLQNDP